MNTDSIEKLDTVNNTVTTPINNTVSDSVTKTRKVLSEKQLAGLQKARDAKQQKKTLAMQPIQIPKIPKVDSNFVMLTAAAGLGLLVYFYMKPPKSLDTPNTYQQSPIQMQPMESTKSRATLDSFFS